MSYTFYYQEYLSRVIQNRKKRNPSYSLRSLAKSLEINPSTLCSIIKGSRSLSLEKALEIAKKLNLNTTTTRLFTWGTTSRKDTSQYQEDFIAEREVIDHDKKDLFSQWQHLAILQLFKSKDFQGSTHWISRRLALCEDSVIYSLEILSNEGLVQQDDQGCWTRTSKPIITSSTTSSEVIRNAHKERLQLAQEKLNLPLELRNYAFSNISIDLNSMEELKRLTRKYFEEVEHLAAKSQKDQLYQLSIQYFPLAPVEAHE